jgi:hypothetical protein
MLLRDDCESPVTNAKDQKRLVMLLEKEIVERPHLCDWLRDFRVTAIVRSSISWTFSVLVFLALKSELTGFESHSWPPLLNETLELLHAGRRIQIVQAGAVTGDEVKIWLPVHRHGERKCPWGTCSRRSSICHFCSGRPFGDRKPGLAGAGLAGAGGADATTGFDGAGAGWAEDGFAATGLPAEGFAGVGDAGGVPDGDLSGDFSGPATGGVGTVPGG